MENDNILRPNSIDEFIGQESIIEKLKIHLFSAKKRKSILDHMLFYGPPGLGKTSLAYVIANELDVKITTICASSLKEPAELISILNNLQAGEVLFIDEIHNIDKKIEEILYSAMEDYKIYVPITKEGESSAVEIELAPFTLIGATTEYSLISFPLRDRFVFKFKFEYYKEQDLRAIILQNSLKIYLKITNNACIELSKRCRLTPRIANNNLKKIADYSIYKGVDTVNIDVINDAFKVFEINKYGLDETDIRILKALYYNYKEKAVSLDAISMVSQEKERDIKTINEPYLVSSGLIERTKQGRKITEKGISILKEIENS